MLIDTTATSCESFIPFAWSRCNCGTFSKEVPNSEHIHMAFWLKYTDTKEIWISYSKATSWWKTLYLPFEISVNFIPVYRIFLFLFDFFVRKIIQSLLSYLIKLIDRKIYYWMSWNKILSFDWLYETQNNEIFCLVFLK
jgi:hypothetical protein